MVASTVDTPNTTYKHCHKIDSTLKADAWVELAKVRYPTTLNFGLQTDVCQGVYYMSCHAM